MRILSLTLLAITLAVCPGHAHADPADHVPQSKEYLRGREALRQKNWEEAYRIFSALWERRQTYDVALNLGHAELQLAKNREAAEHLQFGIRNLVPREKPEVVAAARELLVRAKQYIATLKVRVDREGAEIFVDGQAAGKSPLDVELYAEAGKLTVRATHASYAPVEETLVVQPGEERTIELRLSPFANSAAHPPQSTAAGDLPSAPPALPQTPHAEEPSRPSSGPVARTVVLVAGVATTAVAAASTIFFKLRVSSLDDDAQELRGRIQADHGRFGCSSSTGAGARECLDLERTLDSRSNAATAANLSLVITGVAAVLTGTTFLVWPSERPSVALQPMLSAASRDQVGGLTLRGSF